MPNFFNKFIVIHLVGALFLDLNKASESLCYRKMISKLSVYGMSGTEREWFTSVTYLTDLNVFNIKTVYQTNNVF